MWHHRQGASAARLERDNLSGADAFVRSEHDSQAVDRILHVIGQIQILLDGAQQIGLLSIAEPLAAAGLSIFAISTYETDYVLLKAGDVAAGVKALRKAGHRVTI